jgi:hypothetical protein
LFSILLAAFSYYPRGKYNTNNNLKLRQYDYPIYQQRQSQDEKQGPSKLFLNSSFDYEMPINPEYFINSGCILGRRKEMKNLLK